MRITASQIRQNSSILQKALKEDIVVTKRDEPFVVIVDYDKYLEISKQAEKYRRETAGMKMRERWLESALESESGYEKEDIDIRKNIQKKYKDSLERFR